MALVTILWRKITLNNAVHRVALMRTIIEDIAEFKAKIKEIEAEIEKRIRNQKKIKKEIQYCQNYKRL